MRLCDAHSTLGRVVLDFVSHDLDFKFVHDYGINKIGLNWLEQIWPRYFL